MFLFLSNIILIEGKGVERGSLDIVNMAVRIFYMFYLVYLRFYDLVVDVINSFCLGHSFYAFTYIFYLVYLHFEYI